MMFIFPTCYDTRPKKEVIQIKPEEPMEEERVHMGWGVNPHELSYVSLLYQDEAACKRLIDECDLLIVGWMNREDLVQPRIKEGKLTLRLSERIYREGQYKAISPRGLIFLILTTISI